MEGLAGSLDARGVANISWALAKLVSAAAAAADKAAESEARQAAQQPQLQQDTAKAASLLSATRLTVGSLLSLPAANPNSAVAVQTASAGASRGPAGAMLPQHLANGLWAAATLGLAPGDAGGWPLHAVEAARPLLATGAFTEEGLSQLVWAASELGVVPDDDWAQHFYGAAGRLARTMSPHNSSNILLALARLTAAAAPDGARQSGRSVAAAQAEAEPGRRRLTPPSAAWLSRFLDATAPRLETSGDALALANGVWALAVLQGSVEEAAGGGGGAAAVVATQRWLRACYSALQGTGSRQQVQVQVQVQQPAPGLTSGGAWVVERLSDQDVARVLWGLARLQEDAAAAASAAGVSSRRAPQPPAGLLAAAERRLLGRATGFSAMADQSFAMASWGLARLQQLQQQQQQGLIERQQQARQGADSWQAAWLDSATMRLSGMPVQGLLLTLRAASAWGVALQPAAAASGRGQAAAGPAASTAAAAAQRFLAAATAAVLQPCHAHLRPRLLLALLDVSKAMSVLPLPSSATTAAASAATPEEEEAAQPSPGSTVAAGRALLEVVAGELHAAAAAPPARRPATSAAASAFLGGSGAAASAPQVWDATSLLRCGAAMAEVGYVPPPWWRQTFFGRVVTLAGLPLPATPASTATSTSGVDDDTPGSAAGMRVSTDATAVLTGPRVGGGAAHNLSAGDVLLLLTCSQAWSATASDATLGGLLYGVPYGGWQPHVAAEVCRLLAAQERQRAAAARQQRYAVQRQQLAAAAAAAAAARASNGLAAAMMADLEPSAEEVAVDGRVAFANRRRLNGALNGTLNGTLNGSAGGHSEHGGLNGNAEGHAWREDGLGSAGAGSGSRHFVSLQRGPGRPVAAGPIGDGRSLLSTWPGDSSGDSDSDGAVAAASAAAAAAAAAAGAVALAVPLGSISRSGAVASAGPAAQSAAEPDSSAAPQALRAASAAVGRRTPAHRFIQQVVGIACTSLAAHRPGGMRSGSGSGNGSNAYAGVGAGAAAGQEAGEVASAPLDAPWTPRCLCVLLEAAHSLGLQLSRGQRRALALGLAHHLQALATAAPPATASAAAAPVAAPAAAAAASSQATGVSPAADLVPLLWSMSRLGVTPAMLGQGGRAALVAALARSPALQPGALADWQLFMALEVMQAWRVVPPTAWAQRVPQRLVAWLQGPAGRRLEDAAAAAAAGAHVVDMPLLLTAVRSVHYLRGAAAASSAAAAAAAAAPPAAQGGQPAPLAPPRLQRPGAPAPGGSAAAAASSSAAPAPSAAFDDHVWPQLWPALRTAVRLQLPTLFALSPSSIPTCAALPHFAEGAPALAPAAAAAPARERLAALLAGAALGVLTYEDWTSWAVVELRGLAHNLPPPLYPAWLRAAAAARPHFPRSAHEDTLVAFCLASGPRLQVGARELGWDCVVVLGCCRMSVCVRVMNDVAMLYSICNVACWRCSTVCWERVQCPTGSALAHNTPWPLYPTSSSPSLPLPCTQALPPSLLHATLLAAGRAAKALRTQLSPDWASEGLRRYSRCPDALPPGQLAQVLGVLRLLGRVPPPRWQVAYAGVVRQALPRMDPAAAAAMLRDAAAIGPELEGLLRGIVGEHMAALARTRRLQQEQLQQQMLLAQQQALQGQGQAQFEGEPGQGQEQGGAVALNGTGAGEGRGREAGAALNGVLGIQAPRREVSSRQRH